MASSTDTTWSLQRLLSLLLDAENDYFRHLGDDSGTVSLARGLLKPYNVGGTSNKTCWREKILRGRIEESLAEE